MNIFLVGKTDFDLASFSATVYHNRHLDVNRAADQGKTLCDDERALAAVMSLVPGKGSVHTRLREEITALRFFHYTFLAEYNEVLEPFLQSYCFRWVKLADNCVLIEGSLLDWIISLPTGTAAKDPFVVEFFDRVYLYLKEVHGLQTVMSRFKTLPYPGSELFRLVPQ